MQEEKVIQISRVPVSDKFQRPEIIAITSKAGAQKILSALAEQRGDTGYRYAVTAQFNHPSLPGMER